VTLRLSLLVLSPACGLPFRFNDLSMAGKVADDFEMLLSYRATHTYPTCHQGKLL